VNDCPNTALYEAMIEKLLDIQHRASSSNIDPLTASFEALGAVLEFLNKDTRIVERDAARPLFQLMLAVHDRTQGAKPGLLFDPPDRKGAKGAPSHTSTVIYRTLIVTAFLSLREGGMSKEEASKWLAAELKRSGINQPNGHFLGERAIARWSAELGGKSPSGSDEAFGMFVHGARRALQEAGHQKLHSDTLLGRSSAQAVSQVLIKLLTIAGF
jgi:hypothetical protein